MSKAMEAAELAVKLDRAFILRGTEIGARPDFQRSSAPKDALKLMRLSASLRGIAERQCNGLPACCARCGGSGEVVDALPEHASEPYAVCPECEGGGNAAVAKRERRLVKAVTETLAPYGLKWTHNTDPRGAAVGILFPDGSYNTLGGKEEGWRI